jgi:hypothetical protein
METRHTSRYSEPSGSALEADGFFYFKRSSIMFYKLCVMVLVFYTTLVADWGSVSVGKDGSGNWFALLENSQLRVKYGGSSQGFIQDFLIKSKGVDVSGNLMDAAAVRGKMTLAKVIKDSVDEKTVYLTWEDSNGKQGTHASKVSIFPNSKYIRISYLWFAFGHIAEYNNNGGTYTIYGYNDPNPPQYEKCLFFRRGGDFACTGENAPANSISGDPGPLDYNGWMIMGVYNAHNNGFGRVMPTEKVSTIKLLFNSGFEIFMYKPPVQCYMMAITGGGSEVLSLGKSLTERPLANLDPPQIDTLYIKGENTIELIFNEQVQKATAEQLTSYRISRGVTITKAVLQPDYKTVMLTTTTLAKDILYKLSVYNMRDQEWNTEDYAYQYFTYSTTDVQKEVLLFDLPDQGPVVSVMPRINTISFVLHESISGNRITLNIYDMQGRNISNLTNLAGDNVIRWHKNSQDGNRVSPGVYGFQALSGNTVIYKDRLVIYR